MAGLCCVWSVLPLAVGWTPRAIMSGSMEPRIHVGDVIVGRPVDPAQLVKDQVVTVTDPDHPAKTRTHRLLRRDARAGSSSRATRTPRPTPPRSSRRPCWASASSGCRTSRRPAYWWAERAFVPLGTTLGLLLLVGLAAAAPLRLAPRADRGASSGTPTDPPVAPPPPSSGDMDLDEGLDILTPVGATSVARTPRRRSRRALTTLMVAGVASLLLGVAAPAQAAYARTAVNGTNSWKAAADFRPYRTAVMADSPFLFWRLDETSGTVVDDETAANRDGTLVGSGYAWGQAGALASGSSDRSLALTDAVITGNTQVAGPARFSVEAWVRTTSATAAGPRLR